MTQVTVLATNQVIQVPSAGPGPQGPTGDVSSAVYRLRLAYDPDALLTGANAGALALLGAWVVRDLQSARRGQEIESDLLGVAFIAGLLLLLPAALDEPDPLAGIAGALVGLIVGLGLARLPER